MRSKLNRGLLACALALSMAPTRIEALDGVPGANQEASGVRGNARGGQYLGGGSWKSRRSVDDRRGWQIELKRSAEGAIVGQVRVLGSEILNEARLEGRIDGNDVYGVLLNQAGTQIGTFHGSLSVGGRQDVADDNPGLRIAAGNNKPPRPSSLKGTYTLNDGDSGDWEWEGALPE